MTWTSEWRSCRTSTTDLSACIIASNMAGWLVSTLSLVAGDMRATVTFRCLGWISALENSTLPPSTVREGSRFASTLEGLSSP